jgi:hypothetical protein
LQISTLPSASTRAAAATSSIFFSVVSAMWLHPSDGLKLQQPVASAPQQLDFAPRKED